VLYFQSHPTFAAILSKAIPNKTLLLLLLLLLLLSERHKKSTRGVWVELALMQQQHRNTAAPLPQQQ